MQNTKKLIISYLQMHDHVKRSQLLAYLKMKGVLIKDRHLRATVSELINKDGYLIQSSSDGYKLIRTRKEFEKSIDFLNSYIKKLSKRAKNMKRNFDRLSAKLVVRKSKLEAV